MKKWKSIALSSLLVLSMLTGCSGSQVTKQGANGPVELNAIFMKQAGYSEEDVRAITDKFIKENPNIKVNMTFVPYEALEQKILTSAATGGYDVVTIDAPWTAKFATANIIKDVSDKLPESERGDIFKGALEAVAYKGKLYGMPWLNDTKYLFYNTEILQKAGFSQPPKTWDELVTQATAVKDKGLVQYPIVWSWAQAEALSCDITSITEAFGGKLVTNGKPTVNSPENKKALEFMVKSIRDGLSNPHSTEYLEEDVRKEFSAGKAAFALNWTYMYNMANDAKESQIVGKVGIAPSPGTGSITSSSVNGGMGLSIASGSKNPDAAWKYIQYLSNKGTQKTYAKNALPIWKSLYDVKEVIETNPQVVAASKTQYQYLVNRPQAPWYGEFSTKLQVGIQKALLGQDSVDNVLNQLQSEAEGIAKK